MDNWKKKIFVYTTLFSLVLVIVALEKLTGSNNQLDNLKSQSLFLSNRALKPGTVALSPFMLDEVIQQGESQFQTGFHREASTLFSFWGVSILILCSIAITFVVLYLGKKNECEKYIVNNDVLKKEVEDLSRSNMSKDRFFSILAHDLRNPYNNLLQGLELLKMEYRNLSDHDRISFITSISKESLKFAQFLEHLLTWGKSQRGKVNIHWENLWIWNLADEILEFYRPSAQKKKIILINKIPRQLVAKGDRNLVETVLRNLISNALKFTDHGGQIVLIGGKDQGEIVVGVCDNGIGISIDQREHIFELGQEHRKGTDGEDGTGLGLVVCRELMEKMDGGIRVETTPGGGSSFYFSMKSGDIKPRIQKRKQKNQYDTQKNKGCL